MLKYIALIAVLAIAHLSTQQETPLVQNANIIHYVNTIKPGWRAGINERFENSSMAEAVSLLGLDADYTIPDISEEPIVQSIQLPAEFDARDKWPKCVQEIRDQKSCGGCWAFAGSTVFSYRKCIAEQQASNIKMSPQYPISCSTANKGCGGGTLSQTWNFFVGTGSVSDADYPFTSGNGVTGQCALKSGAKKYYAASFKTLLSVTEMMQEIYINGPIQVGYDVYNDFFSYKSGVYTYTSGAFSGGHSVVLLGWSVDGYGTPYWIVQNSWSANWGMGGTFYIKRGTNECGIEVKYRPIAPVVIPVATLAPTTTTTTRAPTTTTKAPTTTTRAPTTTTTTKAPTTTTTTREPTTTTTTKAPTTTTTTKAPTTTTTTKAPTTTTTTKAPTTTTTTKAPTTTTTTKAPTTTTTATTSAPTCPPVPSNCPCGIVLPAGETCRRCKLNCPATTTTTTKAPTTTTTTKAPTTTTTTKAPATVPSCWTCPAGYVHWFTVPGTPEPADKCACIPNPNVRNCWTCPPNYVHWFEIQGMAEPTDKCACVYKPAPTPNLAPATCPPVPSNCPCGVVLPAGETCRRCKINCSA